MRKLVSIIVELIMELHGRCVDTYYVMQVCESIVLITAERNNIERSGARSPRLVESLVMELLPSMHTYIYLDVSVLYTRSTVHAYAAGPWRPGP
jgi:hypothetical protein